MSITTGIGGHVAQPPAHLQAVEAGQHQVEHHQVGQPGQGPVEPLLAVGPHLDGEPLTFEVPLDHLGQGRIVIDDQHPRRVGAHPRMLRPGSTRRTERHGTVSRTVSTRSLAIGQGIRSPTDGFLASFRVGRWPAWAGSRLGRGAGRGGEDPFVVPEVPGLGSSGPRGGR